MRQNKKIILASASPRRRELLKNLGLVFECVTSDACEMPLSDNQGERVVSYNALMKARAVKKDGVVVIGADTAVYISGKGLGKPKDENQAEEFLKMLSGKEHLVYTGIAVIDNGVETVEVVSTKVKFRTLSEMEIHDYIKTGSPLDKAGAYGIQDFGSVFVEEIHGDYFNIVGLPLAKLYQMLLEKNIIENN